MLFDLRTLRFKKMRIVIVDSPDEVEISDGEESESEDEESDREMEERIGV